MSEQLQILISALIAFACTCWIHPYVLKVAKTKNIVDNPDARKLQRTPVPVMGGLTVVFGVLSGLMGYNLFGNFFELFPVFAAIIIIMIVGLMDDIISLSPRVRFVIEIVLVLFLIHTTGCQINNFYGLWYAYATWDEFMKTYPKRANGLPNIIQYKGHNVSSQYQYELGAKC